MSGTRKLGRATDCRRAMLRAMVTYLLENGKIETTVTRAKEVRAMAEKMITVAKNSDLHSKRQVFAFVTKEAVHRFANSSDMSITITTIDDLVFCTHRLDFVVIESDVTAYCDFHVTDTHPRHLTFKIAYQYTRFFRFWLPPSCNFFTLIL